ncbi:hypothetical protein [Polaromonas sp.]|uniref:hypothetical protein n=1 Tax=Polaromonas sp. TaxID=1869339 RepID=UPI002FCC162E
MRYQKTAELDVTTYFPAIIGAKHLATRALLIAAQPQVLARCQAYEIALTALQVPALAAWAVDTKAALLSCYDSMTTPLSNLKDGILEALKAHAQINLQRCPYCMLNDPRTWDHYLPKDHYPEYSVYHTNMLYVCFGCNHRKWNYYDPNALLYCHPYFSIPEADALLHCSITVAGGRLAIEYYGAGVGVLQPQGEIVQRHLTRLGLASRFQGEAASLVSNLIGELRHHFPAGIQAGALRNVLLRRYADARAQLGSNAWDSRLWHGLAACDDFLVYVNTQIGAVDVPNSDGFDIPAPLHP